MHPSDHCSTIYNSHNYQGWTFRLFTHLDEWIKKVLYISIYICICTYIHIMEYYSSMKKNEIMPFAGTYMDLQIIILREVN